MDDEDVESEEPEEREPQVTSADPAERKLARKLRIERRLEAIRKLNMPEGEEEEVIVEKTLLQQQLQKSYELLEKLTIEGNEYVTNVRVANDSREADRKELEGLNREKVIKALEEEAESATEQFHGIGDKWERIALYNDPLQINDEIIAQKEKCEVLIRQKDEVIAMLKNELVKAERKFSNDQKKQKTDIETLTKRIETQVAVMRRAYRQELELTENVIMVERKQLLDVNDKRWEELYKKRDAEEQINSDKICEQLEEFEEMCTQLRISYQEKFRETKIQLENQIEFLQQEFQKIKMAVLVNSEKLDYNYQVLRKREDENIIIKSQQKRRINKYQDTINDLRKRIADHAVYGKNTCDKLTFEIQKLQKSVFDIEDKADYFAKLNDTQYRQIWELNRKAAATILDRILMTDKVLHEQQLGLEWVHPEQALLDKTDLPSYKSALQIVNELYSTKGDRSATTKQTISTTVKDNNKDSSANQESALLPQGETMAHRRLLRLVLKLVADKSGFLIEERLREILKPYADHENTLIKIDSVFAALGIKRRLEVDILLEYFLPYTHCPICMGMPAHEAASESEIMNQDLTTNPDTSSPSTAEHSSERATVESPDILSAIHEPNEVIDEIVSTVVNMSLGSQKHVASPFEEEEGASRRKSVSVKIPTDRDSSDKDRESGGSSAKLSCYRRHPLVISSVYILKALKEFVSRFFHGKEGMVTVSSRLSRKRSTISRLLVGEEVKIFWDRFKAIFSLEREELWDGLVIGLQRYHEILKDRKKLTDEVLHLRKQNQELQFLFGCYQKDAEKKMRPPCGIHKEIPIKPEPL